MSQFSWDETLDLLARLHTIEERRKTDDKIAAAYVLVRKAARVRDDERKYQQLYRQYQITPTDEVKQAMLELVTRPGDLVNADIAEMLDSYPKISNEQLAGRRLSTASRVLCALALTAVVLAVLATVI